MIINSPKKMIADDFSGNWQKDMADVFRIFNDKATNDYTSSSGFLDVIRNMGWQVLSTTVSLPSPWTKPTMNDGWTTLDSNFTTQYMKDAFGTVWIEGLVVAAAAGTVFTLNAGYRPAQQKDFATAVDVGGTEGHGRLRIKTTGDVDIVGANPTTWGSLDCCFKAASFTPYVPPCFPLKFQSKLYSGKAGSVVIGSVTDITQNLQPTTLSGCYLQWHNENGFHASQSTNSIVIDNIVGLLPSKTYKVTLIAIPAVN